MLARKKLRKILLGIMFMVFYCKTKYKNILKGKADFYSVISAKIG